MSILATFAGSIHRMVRVWDPRTGNCVATVPARHMPQAVANIADSLAIGADRLIGR